MLDLSLGDEPVLYYYGLEESERSLSPCGAREACSALLLRYWRAPALLRLCRCARRQRCDTRAPPDRLVELNNRAYFQFCTPITNWPECSFSDTPLIVETLYERMNPDDLEDLHHKNVQLTPPRIVLNCRCRYPYYWRLNSTTQTDTTYTYQCGSLPLCKTGDFCGNVNYDLNALYQSCLCPRNHICVHSGGIAHHYISELLYRGKGWKAYCQPLNNDYSYDEY
ncbi:unnamed protein product [Parnassius apollo]|uniref:(apollo) hypothetical protein n=1 Tax=Parnassius apollo TaxID=110799 RepID=A0A8S3W905_PARAO|nr:unnamed protein product [Parnassius apollo]